jgi:hypothetical protein
VPVVERAGREQEQGDHAGPRAGDAARQPPGRRQAGDPDRGIDQAPRLEQLERQNFCGEAGQHVEAAAIHVQIDEAERAPVGEARAIERQQQVAVLGVGVVVPAEAVIAKRRQRDGRDHRQN